jgi:amidase
MDKLDLAFAGIARQAELVRSGEVSPSELVNLYMERIERHDRKLNTFRHVFAGEIVTAAEQAEQRRGEEGLPLNGVPIAIKDTQDVAGDITTYGTAGFDRAVSRDSYVVKRLREAGAIVFGKTKLPELAIYGFTETKAWGITRNPWNTGRTPGGSSGGSAAAVAAGLIGAATASDGAGSIRIPASNCRLVGLKPSRGRVSLAPAAQHWHGLSVNGSVTRNVIDTALLLDVLAGNVPGDAHTAPQPHGSFVDAAKSEPGRLRIGWSLKPVRALGKPVVGEEVRAAVLGMAKTLEGLGHRVIERDPDYGSVGNVFRDHYIRGIHDDVEATPHPERLEPRTRSLGRLGGFVSDRRLARAVEKREDHGTRINRIFEEVDVLLTPVSTEPPIEIGRWAGEGALRTLLGMSKTYPYTGVWNLIGNPAITVPASLTENGPVGVMLVGRPFDEGTLLSLAAQIEVERPWADDRPQVS